MIQVYFKGLLACSFIFTSGCYYLKLAQLMIRIEQKRVPLSQVVKDDRLNEQQKAKINLIQEALKFASHELQYQTQKAYEDFVWWPKDYVVINVVASTRWGIQTHYWRYPFLGKLPYRGFPEVVDAQQEAQRLESLGYDTRLLPVPAFSSLGYWRDPIFSHFLKISDHRLTELIFHELTHLQAYWPESGEFNETWAQFMALWANILFWINDRSILEKIRQETQIRLKENCYVKEISDNLKAWYASIPENLDLKRVKFQEIQEKCLNKGFSPSFCEIWQNNASFISYSTYELKLPFFWKTALTLGWSPVQWKTAIAQADKNQRKSWIKDFDAWSNNETAPSWESCQQNTQKFFEAFWQWVLALRNDVS